MRRTLAILGSAIFLVIAPGIVGGQVPWRICGWHVRAPLLGTSLFRLIGALLIAAGLPSPLGFLRPFRAPRSRHTFARFANAPFSYQRLLPLCMYVAVVALILGQGLFFGSIPMLECGVAVWV